MRILRFLLSIAFLLPLKGWGYTIYFKNQPASSNVQSSIPIDTAKSGCLVHKISQTLRTKKSSLLEKTYFINPSQLDIRPAKALFVSDGHSTTLNPRYYDTVFKKLRPLLDKHERGFLTASTVDEANRISQYLNRSIPEKSFASLHSSLLKQERDAIHDLYTAGKINFLVVVKDFDERARYPGMSLFVDLNRDSNAHSLLNGLNQVLASEQNKDTADIISLMQVNGFNVRKYAEDLEQALENTQTDRMRAELLKLRMEIQRTGNRALIAIEKAADDTVAHILKHGETPQTGDALYDRFIDHRKDPAFIARVKKTPDAWRIFSAPAESPQVTTAQEFIKHVIDHDERPSDGSGLYQRFLQYENDPLFIETVKTNPKAWEVLQARVKAVQEKAAKAKASQEELLQRRIAQGKAAAEKAERERVAQEMAAQEKAEKERAAREKRARESAEKENAAKEKAERKKANLEEAQQKRAQKEQAIQDKLKKKEAATQKATIEKAAQEAIDYLLLHNATPPNGTAIYQKFIRYRMFPAFIEKIKENQEAWEIYEKWPGRRKVQSASH